MNRLEAENFIWQFYGTETVPGLSRERALLDYLGNPQDTLRFVHVAGTNGKGSTCAILERVFRSAGYRTGLFTSPHLQKINERMQINGEMISDEEFGELTEKVKSAIEKMEEKPCWFEVVTAIGFLFFAAHSCEIVVLEVGLGGEFDATNVIRCPECAVITNIGLDHMAVLGSTAEEIAAAKAGIIKHGCDVVLYRNSAGVEKVIETACHKKEANLYKADFQGIRIHRQGIYGTELDISERKDLMLSLCGKHQVNNACTAMQAIDVLRNKGWNIAEENIRDGLRTVRWPARMEVLSHRPLFILDGGHNPQCLEAVKEFAQAELAGNRIVVITGMLRDKNYAEMVSVLEKIGSEFFTVTPDSPRALPGEELAGLLSECGKPVQCCDSVFTAVKLARKKASGNGAVLCVGSLYMAGEVRQCVLEGKDGEGF